jgi:hypothetical protein
MFYKRLRSELHHHFLKERTASMMETPFEQTTLFAEQPQSSNEIKDVKAELQTIYRQQMGQNSTISFPETIAFLKNHSLQNAPV